MTQRLNSYKNILDVEASLYMISSVSEQVIAEVMRSVGSLIMGLWWA